MSATKHTSSDIGGSPHQVPPEPNRWPSIGLAVGVHALLLAFLVVGINWQNNQPVAVEAEVWDTTVQSAAPPPPPPPQAEPEPEPEPQTPAPVARVVEPPKVEEPAPKQPDIALEREKKRKQELKRKEEADRVERELAQKQKREEEKKEKALAEKKARELAKKEEEAEKKELAKQEEADKKKKAEKDKAAKDKAEKLAKEKAEKDKLDKLHAENMKRMMAGAGNPGSTGTAEKSTAPRRDNGYIAAITAKVKGNTHYAGSTDEPGNPTVTFHVEQLPTGDILSIKMTKSSGIPTFDEAVKRAIDLSSPLPKKKDGTVERSLEINFHMKDMQ